MNRLTYPELLQKTIDYCVELGIKELKLEDIGKVPEQPTTWAEIRSQDKLPKIMTYDVLVLFSKNACSDHLLQVCNYFAHFTIEQHLQDLKNMNLPEYTLEWLVGKIGYLEERKNNIYVIFYEELLRDSLAALEKKYGRKKVEKLKKGLGIHPVQEWLIDDHHKRFGRSQTK